MFIKKYLEFINFLHKHRKHFIYVTLILLVFFSFFPRSVEILNQNPVFGFDQGRDYLAVKNIIIGHKFTLIGAELGAGSAGISGIFQGPGFFYLLTIPFIIFGGNPLGGTLAMFALSVLSIVAGFVLGRKLFGYLGAILTALLISMSPILISQARFVWNPHTPTLFVLLMFYCLIKMIEQKSKLFIFLTSFFAGFIYNLELGISIPLCISIFIFGIYLFRLRIRNYLILFLGFFVAFAPMILFEVKHSFLATNGIIAYFTNPNKVPVVSSSLIIYEHAKSFIFGFQQTFPALNNFTFSIILWALLLIVTIWFLRDEKNQSLKRFILFLLLIIPVTFFVFYFLNNYLWVYYLTDISLVEIFLFAYIFCASYRKKFYKFNFLLTIILSFFVFFAFNSSIRTTIYDYFDYGGTAKLKGKIDAIDYIYKDAGSNKFGVFVFDPPIYTYAYDYLFWWYGKQKYNYMPYQDKKGIVYLLIEKDSQCPWRSNGWLETVIKNGTILKTVTLPSGFIVQKRDFD